MKILTLLLFLLIISVTNFLSAQDYSVKPKSSPKSISLDYGYGAFAIKDEFISKEKYSGMMPGVGLSWSSRHDTYLYRLELNYQNSNKIENHNVATDITQFTINQSYLYPVNNLRLFDKELNLWIGPAQEFFFLYNNPEIAFSGFDFAQSFAALFSVGIQAQASFPITGRLLLESGLRLSVLSLGFRAVDSEDDDVSPVKLLTLFKGLNSSFDLGMRFVIVKRVSAKIAYNFDYTRITAWEALTSAGDFAVAELHYHF